MAMGFLPQCSIKADPTKARISEKHKAEERLNKAWTLQICHDSFISYISFLGAACDLLSLPPKQVGRARWIGVGRPAGGRLNDC